MSTPDPRVNARTPNRDLEPPPAHGGRMPTTTTLDEARRRARRQLRALEPTATPARGVFVPPALAKHWYDAQTREGFERFVGHLRVLTANEARAAEGLPPVPARLTVADIPSELVDRYETGSYLGTCDWGHCHRPTAGFAICADEHCPCPEGWLEICDPCSRGILPPIAHPPRMMTWHPVGDFIALEDIGAALRLDRAATPFYDAVQENPGRPIVEFVLGVAAGATALGLLFLAGDTLARWLS